MELAYGVPVPRGVRKDWEASSMTLDSGGSMLRRYGVHPSWSDPIACVAWFDRFGRCRACVGHYSNGRAALLRKDANANWKLTLGDAPAQGGVTRMGGDGEAGSGAEGTSTRSRRDAPND